MYTDSAQGTVSKNKFFKFFPLVALFGLLGLIVGIFFILASNGTKSYERCANLSNENIFCHLDLIKENLSKNPDNQLLVCEQIEVPGNHLKTNEYKNECYLMVSKESSSINICGHIQDNRVYQDACITNVARASKDPTICEKIEDITSRGICKYDSQ